MEGFAADWRLAEQCGDVPNLRVSETDVERGFHGHSSGERHFKGARQQSATEESMNAVFEDPLDMHEELVAAEVQVCHSAWEDTVAEKVAGCGVHGNSHGELGGNASHR